MSLNYTKKTINNFLKPKNIGSINNPDGYAQIGNMVCGDQLDFFLKVDRGRIKDVKFLSFGCASNIATASILTARVKGLTIAKAKSINWKNIVAELGGLPQQKIHCSVMAVNGLRQAILDYEKKQDGQAKAVKTKIRKKPAGSSRRPLKNKPPKKKIS